MFKDWELVISDMWSHSNFYFLVDAFHVLFIFPIMFCNLRGTGLNLGSAWMKDVILFSFQSGSSMWKGQPSQRKKKNVTIWMWPLAWSVCWQHSGNTDSLWNQEEWVTTRLLLKMRRVSLKQLRITQWLPFQHDLEKNKVHRFFKNKRFIWLEFRINRKIFCIHCLIFFFLSSKKMLLGWRFENWKRKIENFQKFLTPNEA